MNAFEIINKLTAILATMRKLLPQYEFNQWNSMELPEYWVDATEESKLWLGVFTRTNVLIDIRFDGAYRAVCSFNLKLMKRDNVDIEAVMQGLREAHPFVNFARALR